MSIFINRTTNKAASQPSPLTYVIEVPEDFNLSKTIEVEEGLKQKKNKQGQLLYKINIKEDGTFEETTENRTITKTEEKEVTITTTDEESNEVTTTITVQEPVEWVDNEVILVPNMIEKTITFADSPNDFYVEEILMVKYKSILETSECDYILADMFLSEEDINLTDKDHKANTGVAIMQLLPYGQAKTKELSLEAPASIFILLESVFDGGVDVYINDTKFNNNKLILQEPITKCFIKFTNNTDKTKLVKSYAIGY